MFPNVKAEMARKDMTLMKLSEITCIPIQRLCNKLSGKGKLTFREAVQIKDALGVDVPLEELFAKREG